MFDANSLIGLEVSRAKEILQNAGFKNIDIVLNAETNDKCDTILVCAAYERDGSITLICGEFLMEIKG